jgi:predicted DNA-binding transcriptional regulator YafY
MATKNYKENKYIQKNTGRLQLIDEIIASHNYHDGSLDRDHLRDKVNKMLTRDKTISIETIDKDIKAIRELLLKSNKNVKLDYSKKKGYHYDKDNFRYFDTITDEDTPALFMAKQLFQLLQGSTLETKFNEIVSKILDISTLSDGVADYESIKTINVTTSTGENGRKWIEPLMMAIYNKEAQLMTYKSYNKESRKRVVSPILLKQYKELWYLVAYDHNSKYENKELVFALHNIESLTVSNQNFVQSKLNIKDYFNYSLGIWHEHNAKPINVKLEFYAYQDMMKTIKVHHSQNTYTDPVTNNLIVEFTVYQSPELDQLILGFSDKAKVLEPAELLERIKGKITKMNDLYNVD